MRSWFASVLVALIALGALGLGSAGCKKELTLDDCLARCKKVGADFQAKCTGPKEICDKAKADGDESCQKTCKLATAK